jgi:hypothetical protein
MNKSVTAIEIPRYARPESVTLSDKKAILMAVTKPIAQFFIFAEKVKCVLFATEYFPEG